MLRFWRRWLSFIFLCFTTIILLIVVNTLFLQEVVSSPNQELVNSHSLLEKGNAAYQAGSVREAIAIWQKILPQLKSPLAQGKAYNNLAIAYQQTGNLAEAIASSEAAIKIYRREDPSKVPALLIEQAQSYSKLGQHQQAISLLEEAINLSSDREKLKIAAYGALGNAQAARGNHEQALTNLQLSLDLARQSGNNDYLAAALNSLANLRLRQGLRALFLAESALREGDNLDANRLSQTAKSNLEEAHKLYAESAEKVTGFESIKALINLYNLEDLQQSKQSNWEQVKTLLIPLPNSREKIYALIKVADKLSNDRSKLDTLTEALNIAKNLEDPKAQSFALGNFGKVYLHQGKYEQALELSRQATLKAQQIQAGDSLYRWQWQSGKILKAMGNKLEAVKVYREAIATLQTIRGDLITARQDLQFDFREQVEPVYRELIGLLLELNTTDPQQPRLQEVIDTLELLKLAELENFFGDECVEITSNKVDINSLLEETETVVIYSVILADRTELILRSPDGLLKNYSLALTKPKLEKDINQLRYFQEYRATEEYLTYSQQVYNLLINPIEADLNQINPQTILWINDGILRNISLAALFDGQEFLIEKYPLATTPSLTLTTGKILNKQKKQALILGLTVARPPFAPLKNVQAEIEAINQIFRGKQLVNQDFTLANFETQLSRKNYPIVHIATHGKFGVDGDNTFLVAYDQKINIETLDNILRSRPNQEPIELLTMSACQTAAGDERSTLGIAGVAVRAGASSALATLWYINDEATVPLIQEFYLQLRQPEVTKAEALRRAQIKMIKDINYNHPGIWSPFMIIGNWI